jgi:hypothetical protein
VLLLLKLLLLLLILLLLLLILLLLLLLLFGAVALVSDVGAQEGSLPGLGPRPRHGRFAPPLCGGPLVQGRRLGCHLGGARARATLV